MIAKRRVSAKRSGRCNAESLLQVTEVGTMNFFVHWRNEDGVEELVTAPLDDGTVLAGAREIF